MSVIFVGGVPGTGKTLFCTYLAKKKFKKENRLGAFSKYLLGTGEKTGIVTTMKKDKKRLGK